MGIGGWGPFHFPHQEGVRVRFFQRKGLFHTAHQGDTLRAGHQ